ncbi:hypothetical protein V6N12_049480 [Hibiscus sabdariffa]|uniref:THH1/TOM1/TOM3 domain-containing protein n=1 Tax=Hibiscus sabdariffa TaxID=183260 RepID=A0ABR2CBF8_9ROSI
MGRYGVDAAVISYKVNGEANWWRDINDSPLWQDRFFHILAALYFLVAAVAIVQLVRIHLRVPEFGWTTQKVFHLLNFLVNGVRGVVFVFRRNVQALHPEIVQHILLDMPSLAFFTTYSLLVLFWAEIYYQARAESTDGLRPIFFAINAVVYTIQILVTNWTYSIAFSRSPVLPALLESVAYLIFFGSMTSDEGFISDCNVAGTMVEVYPSFGCHIEDVLCRLFLMLQRFPVESQGRRNKLQEVGYVTIICVSCFVVRCIMVCFSAFDKAADLDVLNHPVLDFIYYMMAFSYYVVVVVGQLVEILPSALVLFILRKLPPSRGITQYHPIH